MDNDPDSSGVRKRTVIMPLGKVRTLYEESNEDLRQILNENPLDIDDAKSLFCLSKDTKTRLVRFTHLSNELNQRLIKIGSLEEAQQTKSERHDMKMEVKQQIDLINAVIEKLGGELVSNIDTQSIVSRLDVGSTRDQFSLRQTSVVEGVVDTGSVSTIVSRHTPMVTAQPINCASLDSLK